MICAVIGGLLAVNSVWADDIYPPDWRGDPLTTYQRWEFGDNDPTPLPDEVINPAGMPTLEVMGDFPLTAHLDEYEGRTGVWRFEDYIQVMIPNFNEDNPIKDIWIQLTYTEDIPFMLTIPDLTSIELINKEATGDYWHATYHIIIEPNPDSETIYIQPTPCTMYLDELVIDTRCVPEPTTICLLGLGALALLRKRK